MEKKIIVLGGLGKSERRDRCVDRIVSRGGVRLHYVLTFRLTSQW